MASLTALALPLMGVVAGCDTSQYAFRVDDSITIEAPGDGDEVELPVTVRWVDSSAPTPGTVDRDDPAAEYYAVFVDRAPIRPGGQLSALAEDSAVCPIGQSCPDEVQLREKGVYLTAEPEVRLEFLGDRRVNERNKDPHDVTVVRMVGDERQGEVAWNRTFFVAR